MTMTPVYRSVHQDDVEIEVLIKEARRKSFQRRLRWSIALVVIFGAAATVYLSTRNNVPAKPAPVKPGVSKASTSPVSGVVEKPEDPYLMTVSGNGTLFVVDVGRDQILRRSTSGDFVSVVGDGRRGFAGDGGQALKARINITTDSGIVIRNGILYFSDTGNDRIREVLPDGTIKTVAGGGKKSLGVTNEHARSVRLNYPTGVAFGPDGDLYLSTMTGIYRLEAGGTLQWVVGKHGTLPKSWKGVWSNPAIQYDFTQPLQIAFDSQGNLFDAGGGGGWGLYERVHNGQLKFLGVHRGDGNAPSLAESSNGSVVMASRFGIVWISPSGKLLSANVSVNALNNALGRTKRQDHENIFIGGDGIAASSNGTIYVDTNTGNTFTSVSAILAITPSGRVNALWRS
jgi:hypothetical protein